MRLYRDEIFQARKCFFILIFYLLDNVFELQGEFACLSLQSIDMTSIKGNLLSDVTLEMISLYSIKKKKSQYSQQDCLANKHI